MKKELLIKYIQKETSDAEEQDVYEWINQNPKHKDYFLELQNLWVSQHLDNSRASDDEFLAMRQRIELEERNNTAPTASIPSKKQWLFWGYAASILLFVSIGLNISQYLNSQPEQTTISTPTLAQLPHSAKQTFYTNKGIKAQLTLPDGSKVWLNSDSYIQYPNQFGEKNREILFSGEGYFEVEKDPTKPMLIRTQKGFKVEVLGTSFNLKAYNNDDYAETTLYTGALQVRVPDITEKKERITQVKPLKSYTIKEKTCYINSPKGNIEDKYAWKDGVLIFDETPMKEVIKALERWHGTEFDIRDNRVYNYYLTATFKSESIIQIMEMIKLCTRLDYQVKENQVKLFLRKI